MNANITDTIKYIGVYDKDVEIFESQYKTPFGMAFNSYIILDEKIAILDTIDENETEKWLCNMDLFLNGKSPDYLIISHLEPDHAANIKLLCEKFEDMKLVGNARTFSMLPQFFDLDFEERKVVVSDGETLSLGSHKLTFYLAPMVHWPEVMVTYDETEKVLFSADGFGRFGSNDEGDEWNDEARRYYYNIVGKYGVQVQALLGKAATLDILKICPLHGPVLNTNLEKYIRLYDTWSKYEVEQSGVLIAYASIYGHTANVAKMLSEMLQKSGVKTELVDLTTADMAFALSRAFIYDRLVIAASSYDGGLFPVAEYFLMRLKSKLYKNRTVGIIENGSWGPVAGKVIKSYLEQLKDITILEPTITIKTSLNEKSANALKELCEKMSTFP
ncbi:MAG: FprA family A-type flavoprotein [Oscillospiraceae bacterium]